MKQYDKSLEHHQKAAAMDPDNADYQRGLGVAYVWLKQYDKSLKHLQKAAAVDPDNADNWNSLGMLFIFFGKIEKALTNIEKSIETGNNQAEYCNYLGLTYLLLERFEKAEEAFSKFEEIEESNMILSFSNKSMFYYHIGRWQEVQAICEKALSLDREFKDIRIRYTLMAYLAIIKLNGYSPPEDQLHRYWDAAQGFLTTLPPLYQNFHAAKYWALKGEIEKSLDFLEKAKVDAPGHAIMARFDPAFHWLQENERFQTITNGL